MSVYKAEYIWIDGTEPTAKLRSKGKVVPVGEEPPVWGFDGSSTNQAPGEASDCVLNPVFSCPDPIRGGNNILVMCEVLLPDMTPHPSNTRAACAAAAEQYEGLDFWFGIEQEYTFFTGVRSQPLGWPDNGFPAPQGGYYCGVGSDEVFGRPVVEEHMDACIEAGLQIAGINAEVMPAQWSSKLGRSARPQLATISGSRAGCCIESERGMTLRLRWTPSRSRATGMARARILTSRRMPCANLMTPASRRPRLWARTTTSTLPTMALTLSKG